MKENKFREYKKLIIGTTHELTSVVSKLKEIEKMKYEFIAEKELLTKEQKEELVEYENITRECFDYIDSL
jgi:hypothetical protein